MGWWFDYKSCEVTEKLRDFYHTPLFIETGTFRGINLRYWAARFPFVIGVEKDEAAFAVTRQRTDDCKNRAIICESSPRYLLRMAQDLLNSTNDRTPTIMLYLDAHFYDPTLPPNRRWVIKEELEALRGFAHCIIQIHDFDCNGLGHLTYDGQPLNMDVVREGLLAINPNFYFYSNTREGCAVHTAESIRGVKGLAEDAETLETITYHQSDRLKYRGILYATPTPLDVSFGLTEIA